MIETDIRAQVVVLSLLSGSKVGLSTLPEGTALPYVILTKVSAPRASTHEGPDGTVVARFQVSAFGETYQQAKQLAALIYPLQTYSTATIRKIVLSNENDLYESDTKIHHVALDFMVYHYE